MAVAKARSLNEQSVKGIARTAQLAVGYISQASVVLQYANDLADAVLSGTKALNDACEEAQRRKAEAEREEGKMTRQRRQKGSPDWR